MNSKCKNGHSALSLLKRISVWLYAGGRGWTHRGLAEWRLASAASDCFNGWAKVPGDNGRQRALQKPVQATISCSVPAVCHPLLYLTGHNKTTNLKVLW